MPWTCGRPQFSKPGESHRENDAALHGMERGQGSYLFQHMLLPPNLPSPLLPPKGGRRCARCDTATQDGGHPTEAQRGKGGLAESPTGPLVG